jgi:hypothetical protein
MSNEGKCHLHKISDTLTDDFTLLDYIFKPMFVTLDQLRANKEVQSQLYDYLTLPYDIGVKENR